MGSWENRQLLHRHIPTTLGDIKPILSSCHFKYTRNVLQCQTSLSLINTVLRLPRKLYTQSRESTLSLDSTTPILARHCLKFNQICNRSRGIKWVQSINYPVLELPTLEANPISKTLPPPPPQRKVQEIPRYIRTLAHYCMAPQWISEFIVWD